MRRAEQKEGSSRARLEEDLEEARERLDAERAAQRLAAERVEATTREVELLRADLAATRQNLDKAEADKTRVRCCPENSIHDIVVSLPSPGVYQPHRQRHGHQRVQPARHLVPKQRSCTKPVLPAEKLPPAPKILPGFGRHTVHCMCQGMAGCMPSSYSGRSKCCSHVQDQRRGLP